MELKKIIFIFLIILYTTGCKKEEVQPVVEFPAYKESGTHTAAFENKGIAYIVHNNVKDTSGIIGYYIYPNFWYELHYIKGITKKIVRININNLNRLGAYKIGGIQLGTDHNYAHFEEWKGTVRDQIYVTNSEFEGSLTITKFDTANKIIAGYFNFNAEDFYFGDTTSISRGQFDIIYDSSIR